VQKLLLMSVLLATFAVPAWSRRRDTGTDPFTRVARAFLAFTGLYVLALLYVYPRLH
jgi:hypothetical protein